MENLKSDEAEFERLMCSYGASLARYVRHRIIDPSDAEDVLQETLVAVWLGFRGIRDPSRLRAWLMHVAQNRCRDFFRKRARCEMPLEEEVLQSYANRFGLRQYQQAKTFLDVMEALETAPLSAGRTAHLFYLKGLSISEIASLSQTPSGTVKRQLFQARHAARTALGISQPTCQIPKEETNMAIQNTSTAQSGADTPPAFPTIRPDIKIVELDTPSFVVDCRELRSWSIIPCVGEGASSADYSLSQDSPTPQWRLAEVSMMQALRKGAIHGIDCVEIETRVWKPQSGWQRPGTIHARLTDDKAEYLAVHLPHEEFTQLETFLDETFPCNWGTLDRSISDQGKLRRTPDGSILVDTADSSDNAAASGFGVVDLKIGDRRFTCLRVLELPGDDDDLAEAGDYATESFLTREGRTVLVRRFCPPLFVKAAEFPVVLDETNTLIISGVPFVHWYDTITQAAI